jgi:hypothetical protein
VLPLQHQEEKGNPLLEAYWLVQNYRKCPTPGLYFIGRQIPQKEQADFKLQSFAQNPGQEATTCCTWATSK